MSLTCDVCRKNNNLFCTYSQQNRAICKRCALISCEKMGHKKCHTYHKSEAFKQWELENNEIRKSNVARMQDMNSW